jgi:SNF2 family DNA or RNA helicase
MSTAEAVEFVPARALPEGRLFHSPLGVFDFQADGLAEMYLRTEPGSDGGALAIWDTGIGKTVLALLLSAYLFEDNEIDQVMVVCEKNKVREWQADFERFTALSVVRYHDSGRQARLKRAGVPHVLVTAYETGRSDLMQRVRGKNPRGKGSATDGPLVAELGLRDKRVLWVFDEPIKFKNRSSGVYESYWYILNQLRRGPHHQRVIGLTATPMDTNYEQAFNVARMMAPRTQPSVGEFEERYTRGRHQYGRGVAGGYIFNGKEKVWAQLHFQPLIIRKRKTDPDVIDQFPVLMEEKREVPMAKDHRDFYNAVMTMLDPPEGEEDPRDEEQILADERRIRTLLRMTAGHPASHLHVRNPLSAQIVEKVTEEGLRAITSSKTAALIEELEHLIKGQGAQVILFEYFTSVIKEVTRELRAAGFTVGEYHGGIDEHERERNKAAFRNGDLEILFLSDAGARGINLPEAQYVTEYSSSTTYSNRVQRGNRNNRIDSKLPSTTLTTMVLDGTLEVGIFKRTIDRNKDLDTLVGDEEDGTGFISAETRRILLAAYAERREGRASRKDSAA